MELWADVDGTMGRIQVSSYGQFRSSLTGRILKPSLSGGGYLGVTVRLHGRSGGHLRLRAHRCVAQCFVPGNFQGAVVNHKDGVKTNNRAENLEWCTLSENTRHAICMGLYTPPKGVKNGRAKLTAAEVRSVRDEPAEIPSRILAIKYGVHHTTISRIRRVATYVAEAAS